MKRRARLALVAVAITAAAGAVFLLTAISTGASGPLASVFARIGAGVGSVENRVRQRLRGPGRSAQLRWLDRSQAFLRRPSTTLLGAYDGNLPASFDGLLALESRIGKPLALIQVYTAWGDKPEHQFPLVVSNAIWDMGSVPVILIFPCRRTGIHMEWVQSLAGCTTSTSTSGQTPPLVLKIPCTCGSVMR
jgi:hypothetical protein